MSAISTILTRLRAAIWAIDVRDDIANAIEQCYSDVSNPTLQTEALEAALQNKIDEGKMAALTIGDHTITATKLASGVIDNTLATSGAAADAKKTGDEISAIKADLDALEPGLSATAKAALLACFEHVKWDDEHGQDYYDYLEAALNGDVYPQIRATFDAGTNVIYTDDALDTLKQYLTVKYYETAQSSGTVISSSGYTLSGTLTEGRNLITATYNNLSAAFTVSNVVDFYNIWDWSTEYSGAGKLIKTPSSAAEKTIDGVRKGIQYANAMVSSNNRRGFSVDRGKQVIVDANANPTIYYPVPIPAGATKLTATITPSTQMFASYVFRYDADSNPDGYDYTMLAPSSISWRTGQDVVEFTAGQNLFVAFNCKKDASGSAYSSADEPSMSIAFE